MFSFSKFLFGITFSMGNDLSKYAIPLYNEDKCITIYY